MGSILIKEYIMASLLSTITRIFCSKAYPLHQSDMFSRCNRSNIHNWDLPLSKTLSFFIISIMKAKGMSVVMWWLTFYGIQKNFVGNILQRERHQRQRQSPWHGLLYSQSNWKILVVEWLDRWRGAPVFFLWWNFNYALRMSEWVAKLMVLLYLQW